MPLNFRKFFAGLNIKPKTSSTADSQGDLEVLSTDGKLRHHNGTSVSPVVTEAHSSTLTNKTIDADSNTITNIENADIKAAAAIDASKIADGSVSNTEFQYLDGVTSSIQTQLGGKMSNTLTSAHVFVGNGSNVATDVAISGDVTIDNTGNVQLVAGTVVNADVNAAAAIDRSKLASGSASHVIVNDGSGVLSSEAQLVGTRGGTGANNAGILNYGSNNVTLNTSGSTSLTVPTSGTVATLAGTETLSNKTFSDAVTHAQISTPSNPSAGNNKMYFKSDGLLYRLTSGGIEAQVGSVGSGGGINFVGLTSSWAPTNTDDRDAELSIGNWVTYADAAGSVPVDMTGGSASQLTLSRTTTASEILNGNASFKVVKSAANAQGQGISCLVNVPVAYQGKVAQINIPYKVVSGSIATGDIILSAYDVTNSVLLTVTPNIVASSNATINALVFIPAPANTPANLQIRIGFHFASTSTTAVTLAWDDVFFGPQTSVLGTIMTDWASYTPTTQGFGTLGTTNLQWRRVGDSIELLGFFVAGTTTASEARVNFPNSLLSSSTKITAVTLCGTASNASTGGISIFNIIAESGVGYVTFSYRDGSTAANTKQQASSMFPNGTTVYINCKVPIQGWSSIPENTVVTAPQDSMVRVDTTNGWGAVDTKIRRFTTLTTNVGPDIVRASSANNGDTFTAQSSGVYNFSGSDVFSSAGNIGLTINSTQLTTNVNSVTSTTLGAIFSFLSGSYCLYSGTLYLNSGDVVRVHGEGNSSSNTSGFFIITKQSVAPISVLSRNKSRIDTTNGWGSTNSNIRKYSTVTTATGTGYTYTSSSTLGDSWTINSPGNWAITVMDVFSSTGNIGLSKNSTQLTTGISSITVTDRLAIVTYSSTGNFITFNATDYFNAGDVIRVHGDGMSSSNTTGCVILTQVSN